VAPLHARVGVSEDKPSSDPDGFLITPPLLLSLQRLAGNRAVSALIREAGRTTGGGHTEGAGELVVQATRKKYPTTHAPGPTAQGEFETFADQVSKLIDTANTELTDLSFVKSWVDTPPGTRILYFQNKWKKHAAKPTTSTALLAAAAGYAIESQVTQLMMTQGMTRPYIVQDPQGGTRPDIVVKASDGTEGWIDLTSQEEAARSHILKKNPSWLTHVNVPFVEENWYPTVDFVALATMAGFGKVPKAKKARKEQAESAGIVARMERQEAERARRTIAEEYRGAGKGGFGLAYGFTDSELKKVLYFAGINLYTPTKPPKGAKARGYELWKSKQ